MSKKILYAMTNIDDDLIIAAAKKPHNWRRPWLSAIATAACLCIVFTSLIAAIPLDASPIYDDTLYDVSTTAAVAIPNEGASSSAVSSIIGSKPSYGFDAGVKVSDKAVYSAYEIAELFPSMSFSSCYPSSNMAEVYTTDIESLNLRPIPTDPYANVCDVSGNAALDKAELNNFMVSNSATVSAALNVAEPNYKISYNSYGQEYSVLSEPSDDYIIAATQNSMYNTLFVGSLNSYGAANGGKIMLDGNPISVRRDADDGAVISSLQKVRERLCDILQVNLKDSLVTRTYTNADSDALQSMTVYFYNAELGKNLYTGMPNSDYITLTFNNDGGSGGEALDQASISFYQYRVPIATRCEILRRQSLISLEQAEQQLKSGLVYGCHVCPLCIAENNGRLFNSYDAVAFEYVTSKSMSVPFYVFYKKTDVAENGIATFAKAYVPAIELTDMNEYFESRVNLHTVGNAATNNMGK